jgi:hypothetical protein
MDRQEPPEGAGEAALGTETAGPASGPETASMYEGGGALEAARGLAVCLSGLTVPMLWFYDRICRS